MSKKQFIEDSIRISKPKLVRPQFKLDNRLTFLSGQKLSITGVDAGVLLKEKLRVTIGYYRVADKLTSLKKTVDETEYQGQYALDYGALNMEFIYRNKRFYSLGAPLEFGFGANKLKYRSMISDAETDTQSGFISMIYFGLSGTFKPFRWIGLKLAVGYRKTIFNQIKDLTFEGFYSSVGLSMDVHELIKDYRMFKLKKTYRKNFNSLETAVDLITD